MPPSRLPGPPPTSAVGRIPLISSVPAWPTAGAAAAHVAGTDSLPTEAAPPTAADTCAASPPPPPSSPPRPDRPLGMAGAAGAAAPPIQPIGFDILQTK